MKIVIGIVLGVSILVAGVFLVGFYGPQQDGGILGNSFRGSPECTASSTAVLIGSGNLTEVLQARSNRCGFILTNDSNVEVYWDYGTGAASITGHTVTASSTVSKVDSPFLNKQAINAISATGAASTTLYATEFIFNN